MSIRELTCPAHGHPVGPDDAYCGMCGGAVSISPAGARQTWPMLVSSPGPEPEPKPATITPIRPPLEFKPLDITNDTSNQRRRIVHLILAALATIACVSLLVTSEVMLGRGDDRDFWVVMWLAWYAATVVAAAGWSFALVQWARKDSGRRAANG